MKIYLIFLAMVLGCHTQKKSITILCTDNSITANATDIKFPDLYSSKDMDGKTINIEGIFYYNFEDVGLYPKKNSRDLKGVWLDFDKKIVQYDSLLHKLSGEKIVVTGTVNLSGKGHLNSYFCTLINISCIKEP